MRYVAPLTRRETEQLHEIVQGSLSHRERLRAQAILWSHKGFKVKQIASLCEVDRDTVIRWFNHWESLRVKGLADAPRSGRPPSLNEEEKKAC